MTHLGNTPELDVTTTETNGVEPLHIGDSKILDAFVNFNFNASNAGELHVSIDTEIDYEHALPIPASEPADGEMLAETPEGLFFGWQNAPVQPPADVDPYDSTDTIIHETAGEIERVPKLSHTVKNEQNTREENSALLVTYTAKYPTDIPTRIGFANEIVSRYINGPLGSDVTPYWASQKHDRDLDDTHREYMNAEITMCTAGISTWEPIAKRDVSHSTVSNSNNSSNISIGIPYEHTEHYTASGSN